MKTGDEQWRGQLRQSRTWVHTRVHNAPDRPYKIVGVKQSRGLSESWEGGEVCFLLVAVSEIQDYTYC